MRTPEQTREYLRSLARNHANSEVGRGEWGAAVGHLTTACGGDEALRRRVVGWLFGIVGEEMSTKYLKSGEKVALINWIASYEEDGHWHPSMQFSSEIALIIKHIGGQHE